MNHTAARIDRALFPTVSAPAPLELAACYRYCEAVARARHHNFPVASHFAGHRLRPHIFAIYAFARTADDIADEARYAGRRASELDAWEQGLNACFHGEPPSHPIFAALAHTITEFKLPITPFASLLAGFRTDLETRAYSTYGELRSYTALAAEPMAHLYLYLAGHRDPALHRFGAELASGLALANFWQHLGDDIRRGRLYVPGEDLKHFGVDRRHLLDRSPGRELQQLLRFEVARTREPFERARPLIDQVGDDLAVELALMWNGGMRILDKIEAGTRRGPAVVPRLSALDKALVVGRSVSWCRRSLLNRARRRVRI